MLPRGSRRGAARQSQKGPKSQSAHCLFHTGAKQPPTGGHPGCAGARRGGQKGGFKSKLGTPAAVSAPRSAANRFPSPGRFISPTARRLHFFGHLCPTQPYTVRRAPFMFMVLVVSRKILLIFIVGDRALCRRANRIFASSADRAPIMVYEPGRNT